jgi:glycogen synthase
MPSSYDAFGLVVLEAMMAGLPVIISNKVGAKDLIRSGVEGFVLGDRPSPADIAERLAFLFKRENRIAMGSQARRTASEHGWEKTGRLYAEVFRNLKTAPRKLVYESMRPAANQRDIRDLLPRSPSGVAPSMARQDSLPPAHSRA